MENDYWEPALIGPDLKPMVKNQSVVPVSASGVVKNSGADDIELLCKSNIPAMWEKAIALGLQSEKPSEVLSILKEMLDRTYGKATEKVETEVTHKYVIMGVQEAVDAESWKRDVIDG